MVARLSHKQKVVGSNPTRATISLTSEFYAKKSPAEAGQVYLALKGDVSCEGEYPP